MSAYLRLLNSSDQFGIVLFYMIKIYIFDNNNVSKITVLVIANGQHLNIEQIERHIIYMCFVGF